MIGPEIVDADAKPNGVLVDFRWGAAIILIFMRISGRRKRYLASRGRLIW
ncbi:hypothetical protein ABE187_07125 [Bacillus cabrialesii]